MTAVTNSGLTSSDANVHRESFSTPERVAIRIASFALPLLVFFLVSYLFAKYGTPVTPEMADAIRLYAAADVWLPRSEEVLNSRAYVLIISCYLFACLLAISYAVFVIFSYSSGKQRYLWLLAGLAYGASFRLGLIASSEVGERLDAVVRRASAAGLTVKAETFESATYLLRSKDYVGLLAIGLIVSALACLAGARILRREGHVFRMKEMRFRLDTLVVLGGLLFLMNVAALLVHSRWSFPYVQEADHQIVSNLRMALCVYWGTISGLCFSSAYLPAWYALLAARRRAYLREGNREASEFDWYKNNGLEVSFRDFGPKIFTMLAPIVVGPLMESALAILAK
jgi:hypothetical protein